MKHFRATHRETGSVIEFGLEDIAIEFSFPTILVLTLAGHQVPTNWMKHYTLEYNHKGEFYEYE